ncbi:MAG: hypothetical protein Q9209_004831 [Squamulea sp. 1 TL-2023]
MAMPQMPPMTPEQLAVVSPKYMSPDQAMMMAAIIGPKDLQYQLDHINDDRGAEQIASVTIVAVLAVIAVALRFMCRRQMKVSISYDDYLIVAGLVFTLGLCFCQAYSVEFGAARHLIVSSLPKVQANIKVNYPWVDRRLEIL